MVVTAATVGVIEDIGASAPTAIAMAIVRIVDMAQLVRPRGTMAAAGLIHTTTHIRAFVAPLAGIMAPAASMALGSTVAGDTPTGDIAAATVAVCTGDGRSPCGAGTAGASPAAEDRQRLLSQASDRRRAGKLLETPDGKQVGRAGEQHVIVPSIRLRPQLCPGSCTLACPTGLSGPLACASLPGV